MTPAPTFAVVADAQLEQVRRHFRLIDPEGDVTVVGAAGPTPLQIEDALAAVGAGDRILVGHIVIDPDAAADLSARVGAVRDAFFAVAPVRGLRQWVVQTAGTRWDAHEMSQLKVLLQRRDEVSLAGVAVVGRSTVASALHSETEELITAADLVAVLRDAAELDRELTDNASVWLVGVSAVRYSALPAQRRLAASGMVSVLERLAAPVKATDGATRLGEDHVGELDLTAEEESKRLAYSPTAGSVLATVRTAALLADVDWAALAPADWPQAIESARDEVQLERIPRLLQQVGRNAAARQQELAAELERAILSYFEDSANISSTADFVAGLAEGLRHAEERLVAVRAATVPRGTDRDTERLRRFAQHLPWRAAVMLRGLLLGLLAAVAAAGPISSWRQWSPSTTHSATRAALVALPALAAMFLAFRWRRLVRARDSLLRGIAADAEQRMQRGILDHRLSVLAALRRQVQATAAGTSDSWGDRLFRLDRSSMALHRRLADDATPMNDEPPASRYSLVLPTHPVLQASLMEAAHDEAQLLMIATLVDSHLNVSDDELAETLIAAGSSAYQALFASGLTAYLAQSPTAVDEIASTLSADLTPVTADGHPEAQLGRIRRYLCISGGRGGGLYARLTDDGATRLGGVEAPALPHLDDVLDMRSDGSIAVVTAFDATPILAAAEAS